MTLLAGAAPAMLDLHGARWTAAGHYAPAPAARRFEQYEAGGVFRATSPPALNRRSTPRVCMSVHPESQSRYNRLEWLLRRTLLLGVLRGEGGAGGGGGPGAAPRRAPGRAAPIRSGRFPA